MLVLSRHTEEEIVIPLSRATLLDLLALGEAEIRFKILDIRNETQRKVRIGFTAPRCVAVHRAEVFERIQREGRNPA